MKDDQLTVTDYPEINLGHPFELKNQHGYFVYVGNRSYECLSMLAENHEIFTYKSLLSVYSMGYATLFIFERLYILSSTGEKYGTFEKNMEYIVLKVNDDMISDVQYRYLEKSPFELPEKWRMSDMFIYDVLLLLTEEELLEFARYNHKICDGAEIRIVGVKKNDSYFWH